MWRLTASGVITHSDSNLPIAPPRINFHGGDGHESKLPQGNLSHKYFNNSSILRPAKRNQFTSIESVKWHKRVNREIDLDGGKRDQWKKYLSNITQVWLLLSWISAWLLLCYGHKAAGFHSYAIILKWQWNGISDRSFLMNCDVLLSVADY